jgi:N-acyl-D-amino-acid deacylase
MKTLIRNGLVYDGTGAPPQKADVLVADNVIREVGRVEADADKVIDAASKCVTPGFIDIHRHCDFAVLGEQFGTIELSQGITTTVSGSCGLTPFPSKDETRKALYDFLEPCLGRGDPALKLESFADYRNRLEHSPRPLNIGGLVGTDSVKICLKGFSAEPYTEREFEEGRRIIGQSMDEGALGISMGIMYVPECYSTRDDLVKLADAAAKKGGVLTCHIRGEGNSLVASVEEILDVAKKSGIPLNISHFKAVGPKVWGNGLARAIEKIEQARREGCRVDVDFYPYTGGATTLLSLIPPNFLEDGFDRALASLLRESGRDRLRKMLFKEEYANWDNLVASLGWGRVLITSVTKPENEKYLGLNVEEITQKYGFRDEVDCVGELLTDEKGKVGIIIMSMRQEDVDTIARLDYSMVISDSLYCETQSPHPRLYASFPKILRDYVRERGILSPEQAIAKMTGMPARKLGLRGRGMIAPGFFADMNIFDLNHIEDNARFGDSKHLSTGMDYVLVNGNVAYCNGRRTGQNSGCVLLHGDGAL